MAILKSANRNSVVRGLLLAGLSFGLASCGVFGGNDKPSTTPTVGDRVPVLSRIQSGAKVDETLAGVSVVLPPAVTNSDWAQPGGDASKTIGHVSLAENPSRIWTASIEGTSKRERLAAAPVVANGKLFAIDTRAQIHAYDAQSGSRLWSTSLSVSGDGEKSVFGGGVSADGTKVYATTGVGEVAALDASTGAIEWRVKPAGPLRGAPTLAFGSAYVITQDNQIYAINAANGKEQWHQAGSSSLSGVFGVAAPAAGQGTVIAGFSTGELLAYRYENGRNIWGDALARTSISTSVSSLTDIDADPIIDRGRVFALGQGGRMAAYELVTGQRIWELNVAGISTPAISGEWIFALTDENQVLCIARSSGKVRWMTQLARYKNEEKRKNPYGWTGPVLAGNNLIVAGTNGNVLSISAQDGSVRELYDLNESVSLPPIVANNILYILDDSGKISAFR